MHGDEKVSLHIHEVREDTVLDLRGQYLQEGHRAVHFAHAEAPRLPKLEGRRRDKILYGQAGGRQPVPFKGEGLPSGMEEAVQQRQPLLAVQHLCRRAHDLEAVQSVRLDAGKPCPCSLDALRLDGQRDILAFHIAVAAALILCLQDAGGLGADPVQLVPLGRHAEQVPAAGLVAAAQGHLHADGGIIAVIEVAEAFKDIPLILRPRQTVADVGVGDGFGKMPVVQTAQAVRVHIAEGEACLYGVVLAVPLGLPDDGLDLLSLLPGESASALASFPSAGGDPPHRPLQLRLLFQSGIGVICLIDTLFRTDEFALDQIAQQCLRGLPVLLIQGEQEKGQHHKDHAQRRRRRAHAALAQKEKRHSNKRRRSETHKLPLRQAEQHLALDFCQVLRDRYVCQWFTSFPQAGYRLQLHFPTHPSRAVRLLRTAQYGAHPP